MNLVVASNNKGKIKEIKEILSGYFDNIFSLREAGIEIEIEETGVTFYENALIKAQAVKKLTPYAVLSDDSGLEVDALDGDPGVYSARYSGTGNDGDNNIKLLAELKGKSSRRANFRSVVVLIDGKGIKHGEGICLGEITEALQGSNGFGYDPLFFSYDLGKTFGEADDAEKNTVSHRKNALIDLLGKLDG